MKDEIQKVTLGTNEALRVTADGEFIWHPEADAMIEEGDFTSSPAMRHILRALRKTLVAPVQDEFDIRGMLASKLTCWNRLRETEANELVALVASLSQPAPVQEPVAWKWHQAPVKTSWGHDMVVADLAIDKDNTLSVYCERDQTAKVEAMFNPPAAPDLQAELDATNRQVEILCDALAESRREIDALVAVARADEREACAIVCDELSPPCGYNLTETSFWDVTSLECAAAIRARGNT